MRARFFCSAIAIASSLLFAANSVSADPADQKLAEYARAQMEKMEREYQKFYGSHYAGDESTAGLSITDCFRFTRSVLAHAFRANRNRNHEAAVEKYHRDGGDLAKYLVEKAGWTSWYWNPDVRHPADGESDHRYYAKQAGRDKKHFYLDSTKHPQSYIPIQYYLINYDPVPQSWFQEKRNSLGTSQLDVQFADANDYRITNRDSEAIEYIKNAPLCFGITEGAVHTFMLSNGEVHEIHYDQYGPTAKPPRSSAESYEKLYDIRDFSTSFSNYRTGGWLSGVLVCAPTDSPIPQSAASYRLG